MAISKNNTRFLLTMPKQLKEQLGKMAEADNRTLSNLIVTILQDYVSKQQKNETH